MNKYIVEMKNIEKFYGPNRVLKNVDFKLREGEIHALLGENGTGKTTLMNILGGVIDFNAGELKIEDEVMTNEHQNQAYLRKKIGFVHQELALLPHLTVAENLFFGQEIKNKFILDNKKMINETSTILKQLEIVIDPNIKVSDLDASYQQIVEISKAIMKDSKVLIMDEPTSSLTESEIEQLFKVLNNLKNKGISIIFISHKLNEVLDICDSYTVLRDGVVVSNGEITKELKENDLAKLMIGRDIDDTSIYQEREIGDVILELNNVSHDRLFKNVDFNIRKGEIVGVTGLLGDGRSELFETVYGLHPNYSGKVILEGQEIKCNSTRKSVNRGIAYVPRNRKTNGIIKDLSISDNLNISNYKTTLSNNILNKQKTITNNNKYKEMLSIRLTHFNNLITSLSGGNQQKIVISKALNTNPNLVILDNPTQGVDIGSKFEIYHHIIELSKLGISFVVLSSEVSEIFTLCDRTYVMFHGEIRDEVNRNEFSEERIMTIATGGYHG